jgi:hypothetical protein
VSQPCLTTIGKPSASLSAKIEQDEKDRLASRRKELGEEKLKELDVALEAAKAESNILPPGHMISDFPLTNVSPVFAQRLTCQPKTLTWVPVETAINNAKGQDLRADRGQVQQHIDADGADLPYQAHFSHVKVSL